MLSSIFKWGTTESTPQPEPAIPSIETRVEELQRQLEEQTSKTSDLQCQLEEERAKTQKLETQIKNQIKIINELTQRLKK